MKDCASASMIDWSYDYLWRVHSLMLRYPRVPGAIPYYIHVVFPSGLPWGCAVCALRARAPAFPRALSEIKQFPTDHGAVNSRALSSLSGT